MYRTVSVANEISVIVDNLGVICTKIHLYPLASLHVVMAKKFLPCILLCVASQRAEVLAD